jgi:uncharacterized sulfatase
MEARAFLGPHEAPARELVFSHRDRMDEAHDTIRSVRDARYHYLRNHFPGRPLAQYIDYMELMPTMKELRRLHKEHMNALSPLYGRALDRAQLLLFRPDKPAEELYDTVADPHEIHDLAASPEHVTVLRRMREALAAWARETADLGLVPEEELRERMRPGGEWLTALAPTIREQATAGGVTLSLASATEGASIVYATSEGEAARFRLYTEPIALARPALLRARACRLGFRDSEEIVRRYP